VAGLPLIFLLAPRHSRATTFVARQSQGFVYYVSLTGITGAKLLNLADVGKNVEENQEGHSRSGSGRLWGRDAARMLPRSRPLPMG